MATKTQQRQVSPYGCPCQCGCGVNIYFHVQNVYILAGEQMLHLLIKNMIDSGASQQIASSMCLASLGNERSIFQNLSCAWTAPVEAATFYRLPQVKLKKTILLQRQVEARVFKACCSIKPAQQFMSPDGLTRSVSTLISSKVMYYRGLWFLSRTKDKGILNQERKFPSIPSIS